MHASVIDGNLLAAQLRDRLEEEVKGLAERGVRPGLGTLLVGDDYASRAYERRVRRLAESVNCHYVCELLPGDVEQADSLAMVGKLNADPRISGVLILRPLPPQVSEVALYRVLDPAKDIEAVTPLNAGLLALGRPRFIPSTPASCFYMLDRYLEASGRDAGRFYRDSNIVVVGRSNNVGKPALLLALARNATLVSCDRHTFDAGSLADHTRQADVLIVAVAAKAEAISPVPGGVGPVTDVWLLNSTVAAARLAAGLDSDRPLFDVIRTRSA